MQKISAILKKVTTKAGVAIDDKTAINIFLESLEQTIATVSRSDIKSIEVINKKLIIKTHHPAIAGEIWKKREKIIKRTNELAGQKAIESISVK